MFKFVSLLCLVAAASTLPYSAYPEKNIRIDPDGDWRVVGGSNAPAGAYPFIVSMRSSAGSHFCGGTIINNQWILTAAQCIIGRTTADTNVLAGTTTLNSGGVVHGSNRIIIHASYNVPAGSMSNDVGVVRLSTTLPIGGNIGIVGLNTGDTGAVAAILAGWGRTSTNGSIANNLQHLAVNTLTHAQCQSSWGDYVSSLQICAVIGTGRGACEGDSGGPLMQNSNRAQLGITSFIRPGGCAQGFPDVYTRVSSYIDWINSALAS